jgi:hypothetical protein
LKNLNIVEKERGMTYRPRINRLSRKIEEGKKGSSKTQGRERLLLEKGKIYAS